MARYPSASKIPATQIPATPLKTLCASLGVAGVVLVTPLLAHADDTCTVPCVFSDGQSHVLADGAAIDLAGVGGAAAIAIGGDGTNLAGNNITFNLGDSTAGKNTGVYFEPLSTGGSLSLTNSTFNLGDGVKAVYDLGTGDAVVLDNVRFIGGNDYIVDVRGTNNSYTISNSQFISDGTYGYTGVQDDGAGNVIHLDNDAFTVGGPTTGTADALEVYDSTGALYVKNSTFNILSGWAAILGSDVEIDGSNFYGAGEGLIIHDGGNVTLSNSTLNMGSVAVKADAGAISVENSTLITNSDTDPVVYAKDAGTTVSLDHSTVTANGTDGGGGAVGYGAVYAQTGAIETLSETNVIANGGGNGFRVGNTGTLVSLADSTVSVTAHGDGVNISGGAAVNLSNSTITGDAGDGAYLAGTGSSVSLTGSTVTMANGTGIDLEGAANATLTGSQVTVENGSGDALQVTSGSATVTDSSLTADAGYALDIEPGTNVTLTGSTASSANSNGTVYMNGTSIPLDGDTITNTGAGTAVYQSNPTQALSITNSNLITNTGYALDIEPGSNVTFTGSTATSANSIGTVYMNGATIPLNGDTLTNTGSGAALYADGTGGDVALTDSHLINSGNGAGLYVGGDADVTLTRSTITAQNGDAIDLGNGNNSVTLDDSDVSGGTLTANGTQNQITLQNDAQLNMNVLSSAGTTDLTATAGSTFTGAAQALDAVTLDPSSHWDMTGDSTIDTLNLNGSTVHFTPASGYATLTANTLNGGGQIAMQTNLADGQGDKLVTNGGSGAYALQIDDHSTHAPSLTNTYYQVVQTQATGPTFSLVGGETDVGAYQYKLTQQNSGWYLFNTTQRTNTVNATLAAQQAASNIWFDELQPLYARMGDLRLTPNNDGVWVRTYGSKERLSPSGADGVDTTLYMTEVGVDHGIHLGSGSWYVGATLGSGNVLESFAGGAGSATATPITAGLYATWASNQGWYGDFVLKYDSLSQHYDTSGSGVPISANSHVNGVTASAEGGMRFQLPHQWFVEPQVELAALYQGGSNYVTSYGTQVSGSGGTATTGRVSVMVGHPAQVQLFPSKPALDLEPYANFSLIRQFSGSSNETVDGAYFSSNVRETRGQIALGVSMQPVHKWQGFVELAYGKGQHYEQPWGFDVGVKKIW